MVELIGNFKQPLKSHKVCSLHFPGGRKVLGALPTCFQIDKHPTVKLEHSQKCETVTLLFIYSKGAL